MAVEAAEKDAARGAIDEKEGQGRIDDRERRLRVWFRVGRRSTKGRRSVGGYGSAKFQGLDAAAIGRIYLEPGKIGTEKGCGEEGSLPILEFNEQTMIDLLSLDDSYLGCHDSACTEHRVVSVRQMTLGRWVCCALTGMVRMKGASGSVG